MISKPAERIKLSVLRMPSPILVVAWRIIWFEVLIGEQHVVIGSYRFVRIEVMICVVDSCRH